MRLKLALTDDLDGANDVIAAGINCLNESATADTTPCLAWNLLFEERGLIWGCEADLTSMITKFIVWEALRTPVMMSNLYPFLMGQAALKHEKIPYFPEVDQPENHVLVAHCGFFGVVPQSWATEWTLRPPVLEIVDGNSHAIDARFPEGDITLVKIASTLGHAHERARRTAALRAVRGLRLPERGSPAGRGRLPLRRGAALAPRDPRGRRPDASTRTRLLGSRPAVSNGSRHRRHARHALRVRGSSYARVASSDTG